MGDHCRAAGERECAGFWQAQGRPRDALLQGIQRHEIRRRSGLSRSVGARLRVSTVVGTSGPRVQPGRRRSRGTGCRRAYLRRGRSRTGRGAARGQRGPSGQRAGLARTRTVWRAGRQLPSGRRGARPGRAGPARPGPIQDGRSTDRRYSRDHGALFIRPACGPVEFEPRRAATWCVSAPSRRTCARLVGARHRTAWTTGHPTGVLVSLIVAEVRLSGTSVVVVE
jgi:hypothetical protein